MKRIASTAAMTRVRGVRLTWSAWTARDRSPAFIAASPPSSLGLGVARLELADKDHDQSLEDEEGRAHRGQERAAAGPLEHPHRYLLDPQALAPRQLQGLDLGEVGRVVLAEELHHPAVGGAHAAGGVGEALAGRQGEHEAEDVDPDTPRPGRPVVLPLDPRRVLGAGPRLGLG